jgi:pimeloyl-ACP methyl ester carboxylesterase
MIIGLLFAAALSLQPCDIRDLKAQCGTFTVPENPSKRGTRFLTLNVVVIPSGETHDDALFVLAGGPGGAATGMASFAARTFGAGGRDIVMVDARGTGKSNALRCDAATTAQELFDDLMAPDRFRRCLDKVREHADPAQYTTAHLVRDLEALRIALGYTRVTLYGTSYGTRLAQEYMRRHPRRVRAVILDGVVPPSLAMPTRYAEGAERSLRRVFDLCRADAACAQAFPDLEADYAAMLRDAQDGIELTIPDPQTNAPVKVRLARGLFGEIFRNFLYSPEQYTRLPFAVHAAAHGDWAPFGEMAVRYARNIRGLDLGLLLSVTCAEDLPRVDARAIRAASANTLLGTYRLDQQLGACAIWPRGRAERTMTRPVRSSIPALIVSGEFDPVTPPEYGDEVARTLTNSVHVVIPAGSHSGDTGGCQETVMSDFIRRGSIAGLDTSCMQGVKRPPFRVP